MKGVIILLVLLAEWVVKNFPTRKQYNDLEHDTYWEERLKNEKEMSDLYVDETVGEKQEKGTEG